MNREKILIIDDEEDMLENCRRLFSRMGFDDVETTTSPRRALDMVSKSTPDMVITDLRMPEMNGIEVLKEIKKLSEDTIVIVFTAFASQETAVQAVKEGAFDYIAKPFSYDSFSIVVDRAFSKKRLTDENLLLRRQLQKSVKFEKIIGTSLPMMKALEMVRKTSDTDANIMIIGENGTGKELFARNIHMNSGRAAKPFIAVDCAALPEPLLGIELFGHEKGAMPGMPSSRTGLFEIARNGTFFLDEITEMDAGTQEKLLEAIQNNRMRRVGGNQDIPLDIRLVTASGRSVDEVARKGLFSLELFSRLSPITISLPPLRKREGDVELLANHYLDHFLQYTNKEISGFTPDALEALNRYGWPGNVKELMNVVERSIHLAENTRIDLEDLPEHVRNLAALPAQPRTFSGGELLPYKQAKIIWSEESEKNYVKALLKKYEGNISRAAKKAEIDRKTLYKLINKHNLQQ